MNWWNPKKVGRRQIQKLALTANPGRGEREMEHAIAAMGFAYERQRPIGRYYADFAVEALRLVIEVDGAGHGGRRDRERDEAMRSMRWTVIRIPATSAKRDPVTALFEALPDAARAAVLRNTRRAELCRLIREWKPSRPEGETHESA